MKKPAQEYPVLLDVQDITRLYGPAKGCEAIDFRLHAGEVLGIVGESGSGKSTLLRVLAGLEAPDAGRVIYRRSSNEPEAARTGTGKHESGGDQKENAEAALDLYAIGEARRRALLRLEWGLVHQNPRDGLRMGVSAGANIGERLMAQGQRHYGQLRATGQAWMRQVELDPGRIDDAPRTFSGGMQQRLQIARTLVTRPRLVFMDEPTGGLDVSVQARLLDMLRTLVRQLGLSVVLVTHDLAVARLLAHRLMVMRHGQVVETGLTDQILDDPQHEYTQLLVSSVLTP
ncbi:putative phosphonate transport system ATP-binding protein [Chromohalobacter marismortui]|uniref:Putative phosphonate transport system ATP-binding protein n=1 Tax=Chromohalobacter marismortui TaxID=42055 RepID=A0A4V3F3P7_9GAMM|nr:MULTISPECIES: phosphonate C-P lyase system protein PhnK [Chromohalobacter]MCI0509546.1 phosphonate C-P lyase system protein PhnK [Chromohalobacter sp.]MCI0592560.1 phosphonate C-P lyase system protein PhnK [Chromohalobacter sp.]TDU22266.1 putative phosphonate transport system ATP-binding protein [Chromohalobacter marismortui]